MMKENDIPTPALVIDMAAVRRNLDTMQAYATQHNFSVRPHIKTHKTLRMARLQLETGSCGLTIAKIGEARLMAQVCDDLFLAYPAVDPFRTAALAELARKHAMRVEVDSAYGIDRIAEAAQAAGSTVGVLVDLDTGMHRTGLQDPQQTVELARKVDAAAGLRLDGLFTYQGHIRGSDEQMARQADDVAELIQAALDLWKENGLEAKVVSGGSTPSAFVMHHMPQLTEVRPGSYIYYDWGNAYNGYCKLENCAARIVATVVSNAVPGKVVLDCGNKTLAMDRLPGTSDDSGGHGHVVEYPDALVDNLTEEHGRVDITKCDRAPKLGERVHVIPNHVCVCVNLQNAVWLKDEAGDCERVAVDARGLLS